MKQQQCWYVCEVEGCDAETSPEATWARANETAREEGWRLAVREAVGNARMGRQPTITIDLCPKHRGSFR